MKLVALFCLFLTNSYLVAQQGEPQNESQNAASKVPKLKLSGSLGLTQDFFNYSTNDLLYRPYRPTSVTRFFGATSLSVGRFSLPFSLSLSTQSGGNAFTSPIPKNFRFRDLLSSYNQLSFSPTFGNFQALIGTQVPRYSELTTGELPIFGGGFDWKPRRWRLAAFWGMSQRGVSYDTLLNKSNFGTYRRMSMTGKFGYGHEDSSHIYIIATRHKDDLRSAVVLPEGERPQENVLGSLDWKLLLFKKFFVQAEGAISAITTDLTAFSLESDSFKLNIPNLVRNIYTPRLSSRYGAAGVGSFGYNGEKWGFRALARLYSSDFRSLNYPFLQTDRLEWLIEPRFSLFKNKFNFTGSIGRRQDNLLNTKVATAYQTLGSANVNVQLTPEWSVSGTYANFGMRNTLTNDTFRIQNVSQNFNVTSNYSFTRPKATHTIVLAYTRDNFDDFNVVTGGLTGNNTSVYLLTYSLGFTAFPLTLSAVGTRFENRIALGNVQVSMASLIAAYPFGKNRDLNVSLQGNIMRTTLKEFTPDDNITTTLSVGYLLAKKINMALNGTLNVYRYGTAKPGIQYRENALRVSASYAF